MERKYLKSFNASLAFPERWFCFHLVNFGLLRFLPTFSRSEDSIYAFYRLQNKSVGKSNKRRKFWGSFNVCLAFPEKRFCIRRANFAFFNLLPTNIQSRRRFDLGFWPTSEQVYRKLQHGEKIFK